MINYILSYLIFGMLILLMIYITTRLDNSQKAKDLRSMSKLIRPRSKNWQDKLFNNLIVPVIAMTLTTIFWPVVVVWVIKDRLERRVAKNRVVPEPEVFKVKKEHMKAKVSIEEIELKEMVTDPLDAVPAVPFGYLNSAWQEFKGKLQLDDELWVFSAQWASEWGRVDQRSGYVITKRDKASDFFVSSIKYID